MHAHRRIPALVAVASIAGASIGALSGTTAWAQVDPRDALAQCRALPTETERLDCMEGLVLDLSGSAPGVSDDAAGPDAPSAPDASPAFDDAEASSDGDRRRLPRLPFLSRSEPAAESSAEASSAAAETATAARAPESYGAERLQPRESGERSRPEALAAQVVSFEEIPFQRLRVELDNGQVWEQRGSSPPWNEVRYGAPDRVEIAPSRFGGYRMRLIGANLALSVQRVQ